MALDAGCFVRSLLRDAIILKPNRMGSNFRDVLAHDVRAFEGVCTRHGYILPGSTRLKLVSPGHCEGANLNGDVRYDVQYYADVCNPGIGAVVSARITHVSNIGFHAVSGVRPKAAGATSAADDAPATLLNVLYIIIVRQHMDPALQSEVDLDRVQIGDTVNVEVLRKQFALNSAEIAVFGRIVRRSPKAPGALLMQHLGGEAPPPAARRGNKRRPVRNSLALLGVGHRPAKAEGDGDDSSGDESEEKERADAKDDGQDGDDGEAKDGEEDEEGDGDEEEDDEDGEEGEEEEEEEEEEGDVGDDDADRDEEDDAGVQDDGKAQSDVSEPDTGSDGTASEDVDRDDEDDGM